MKGKLKAVVIIFAFVVISIGLTWVWNEWLRALYAEFFRTVATTIYDAIGLGHARVAAFRQRYINFVPFVALVLVTPGLTFRRRFVGLGLGLVTISVGHVILNLTALLQPGGSLPIVASLISDSFPFLVWFVVAFPVAVKFIPAILPATPTEPTTPTVSNTAIDAEKSENSGDESPG